MNYYQLLNFAQAINNNDNVNKLILINLLQKDLAWIYGNLNTINDDEAFLTKYLDLVKKYADGFPLGYILGYVYFNNIKIFVNQNVLIPRNETEILVNRSLFWIKRLFDDLQQLKVLDLGTGSGCIAINLALKKPTWDITSSDISEPALLTAKFNQKFYQLNNINFIKSNLFTDLTNQKFNIIISNPPYVDRNSQNYNIDNLKYEPALALFANNNGLDYFHKILNSILNFTNEVFFLAFEIGFDQKDALTLFLADKFSHYFYWFEKDYDNHWRFLFISSKKL